MSIIVRLLILGSLSSNPSPFWIQSAPDVFLVAGPHPEDTIFHHTMTGAGGIVTRKILRVTSEES